MSNEAIDQLSALFALVVERLGEQYEDAITNGDDFQVVIAARTTFDDGQDHWQHFRSFDGAEALEEFYAEAAKSAAELKTNHNRVHHDPVRVQGGAS